MNRRRASLALASLGTLLVLAGGLLAYTGGTLSSSSGFADRATSTLRVRGMRDVVARRVTAQLIRAKPNLIAVRPLIEAGVERIVASSQFQALFRGGTYDLHRSAFDSHRSTLTLGVADAGVLVSSALDKLAPKVAARVPAAARVTLAKVSGGELGRVADAVETVDRVHAAGVWLLVVGLCLLVLSVIAAPDVVPAVGRAGRALGLAGLTVVAVYTVARPVVLGRFAAGDGRTAAAAVWDAFLSDLRLYGLLVAVVGGVVAAGAGVIQGSSRRSLMLRARALLAAPTEGKAGLARGGALVALGVVVILAGPTILRLVVLLAGAALVYTGARELMRVALATRLRTVRARLVLRVVLVGALLVGLAVGIGLLTRSEPAPAYANGRCNGYRALCGRPLDQVAFAATHNSMAASTSPGWLFPSQDGDIPAQLEAGVRGLLIDTHYGFRAQRGVATELTADTKQRAVLVDAVGADFIKAADRLRARIGYRGGGRRSVYLCHAFCEVGATPLRTALDQIRDFLVRNPGEVLLLSVQDDVSPADTAAAFRASGLLDLVYQGRSGPPWPTLGQLIAQGRRVVVFSENQTGGIPWYRPQFKLFEETPYRFRTPSELTAASSCRAGRGGSGKSLFLLNHWVDTSPAPRPTNADRLNAYRVLLDRARRCQERRDRLPNLVAVDFYGRGDLLRVVRKLNGL